ncbi:MAG: hypothetical protein ACD_28C00328G0004 [uncultured bacterium]|nr:MAG: hypothetical protein ACD_28C00328G0004 [uncultured bacterium]
MKRIKLNKDQRKFLSDFLNSLSVAWFSAGVISPFFIKIDDILKLVIQVLGSVTLSVILFIAGIKNLAGK